MALRSSANKSLQKAKELEGNVLSLNLYVVHHYFYSRRKFSDTEPKFLKNLPCFNGIKEQLLSDVEER